MGKLVIIKFGRSLFGGVIVALMVLSVQTSVFAADDPADTTISVLPAAGDDVNCEKDWNPDVKGKDVIEGVLKGGNASEINNILGCGIKTGNIKLYMVPYYIRSVLEFIIGISGLICVGAIVFGGYWYLFAGISEDKEKGKKAVIYGLVGMVLTLVAWALVNIIISLLTM